MTDGKIDETTLNALLDDFANAYSSKYKLETAKSLGNGAYGVVYKAMDLDREIDVAIKFYHEGIVPDGSERGWNLTSKTFNKQISPTFTIEKFKSGGTEYKAVVSRFIPGKSLKSTFDWLNNLELLNQQKVTDDFAFSFFPSLIDVLELCHSLGFGHGDLHEGNIMVLPTVHETQFAFTAVLIDFDNSSIMGSVFCSSEKEKIEKDCRLFKNRVGPYILINWEWYEEVKSIFTSYSTMKELKISFQIILQFISYIKSNSLTKNKIIELLGLMVPYNMNRFSPKPTVDILLAIATKAKSGDLFADSFKDFQNRIRDVNNFTVEVTIITDGHIKNSLYNDFFR